MEIEAGQLQQARALATEQQTARQIAAELDKSRMVWQRETEIAKEREDQVRIWAGTDN